MCHSRTESCDLNLDVLFWSVKTKSFTLLTSNCYKFIYISVCCLACAERNYNTWVPGFGSDELRPYKKATVTEAHRQVCVCVRAAFFVSVDTFFSVCVLCGLVYFLIWQVKLKCPELSDIISYWIGHSYFLSIVRNMIILYNYWLRKDEKHLTVTLNFGTKWSTEILQKPL